MRDFHQCYVMPGIRFFEKEFIKRWKFKPYTDINAPVVFLSVGGQNELINNHKGPKIVITIGPYDLPDWDIVKNRKNLFIIRPDETGYCPSDVIWKKDMLEIKDFSIFKPNRLGDKIYFYSGFSNGWAPGTMDVLGLWDVLKNHIDYELITTQHKSLGDYLKPSSLKKDYYDKCFLSINLTEGCGLTTVRELGLMGRKTILNPVGYEDTFSKVCLWDHKGMINGRSIEENIPAIIKIINEEAKKIGTVQSSMDVHTLTDDRWLYLDYYLNK